MAGNFFDKEYSEYWKQRVEASGDGSKVPDESVERFFISQLNITKNDVVLDLGCGHGRLYPLLNEFADTIEGIDLNDAALKDAAQHAYTSLSVGTAEHTAAPDEHFDKVVAWAMYDGVEQDQGLVEENRVLKNGGMLLITGKNKDYERDDELAFVAEVNAKAKNFPNHFTDVYGLMRQSRLFGFEVVTAYGFPRRGDFGNLQYIDLLTNKDARFYEFLLIFKKVGTPAKDTPVICDVTSDKYKEENKENHGN